MPHTQDRAAASKAQERLERCQQRQLIDRERTAKAKTGIGLAACVLSLPWPKSVLVGLCFLVAVSIPISLCASLVLAFGHPAFSLTCLPFLDAWFLLLFFFFPLCLFSFNPLSLFLLSVSFLASCSIALCASLRGQNGLVVWRGLEVKCAGKERWWLCFPVGCRASSHVTAVR